MLPTLVTDSRDKMQKFSMVILNLVVNKCRPSILIPKMNISHIMVHSKQIKEKKLKQIGRELKRSRTDDGNSSKCRFHVQGKSRFMKTFYSQDSSSTPRVHKYKVPNPNTKGGNSGGSYVDISTCAKSGNKHDGKCLVVTDV